MTPPAPPRGPPSAADCQARRRRTGFWPSSTPGPTPRHRDIEETSIFIAPRRRSGRHQPQIRRQEGQPPSSAVRLRGPSPTAPPLPQPHETEPESTATRVRSAARSRFGGVKHLPARCRSSSELRQSGGRGDGRVQKSNPFPKSIYEKHYPKTPVARAATHKAGPPMAIVAKIPPRRRSFWDEVKGAHRHQWGLGLPAVQQQRPVHPAERSQVEPLHFLRSSCMDKTVAPRSDPVATPKGSRVDSSRSAERFPIRDRHAQHAAGRRVDRQRTASSTLGRLIEFADTRKSSGTPPIPQKTGTVSGRFSAEKKTTRQKGTRDQDSKQTCGRKTPNGSRCRSVSGLCLYVHWSLPLNGRILRKEI